MKKYYLSTWLTFSLFVSTLCFANTSTDFKAERSELRFTENKGQVADLEGRLRPDILFTAHSRGVKLFVNQTGIHYQFMRSFEKPKAEGKENGLTKFDMPETDSTQFYRMDMQLVNANPNATVIKEGEGSDYENFYLGHCPDGVLGVKNYSRITYQNIYPNIDWVIYSRGYYMEYDFVVKPGGNVNDIKIKYDGAIDLKLDASGNLHATTPLGAISETAPFTYQGNKQKIESGFFLLQNNLLAFNVGEYNKNEELVIDPVGEWATYYGGSGSDVARTVKRDAANNVYLGGESYSTTGIASGGFQNTNAGSADAFLVKFNSAGNRMWATYYGGNDGDYAYALAIEPTGNVYLGGMTFSYSGIASGGYQNNNASTAGYLDAFLVKFNSTGNRIWATYYGGPGTEGNSVLSIDISGNIYMAGTTTSTSGIAFGGFQNSLNNSGAANDAFLVKFNSSGSRLWATYYGGANDEYGEALETDATGNVYLGGSTYSSTGIAFGGFQNTYGANTWEDAFLVKFDGNGNRLWATYYGGTRYDRGQSIAIDGANNVYLCGFTSSQTSIALGGYQDTLSGGVLGRDAFLVKFDSNGNRLWGTYYGGPNTEDGYAVVTDANNNVYLAGNTVSTANIASNGFQNVYGGGAGDGFLVKFNSAGSRLWATYYGGSGSESLYSVVIDGFNYIYLAGSTSSASNIAVNGFQNTIGGGTDAFLKKLNGNCYPVPLPATTSNITQGICAGDSMFFNGYYIKTAGTFRDTLLDVCGYDSIIILLTTTIKTVPQGYKYVTICPGTSYNFNGSIISTPGIYRDTLDNAAVNGCDSIVILQLFNYQTNTPGVNSFYDSACISYNGRYYLTTTTNTNPSMIQSYIWSNGLTTKNVVITQPGTYTVQVIDTNGCISPASAPVVITNFPSVTNCGGNLILEADSVINYFDTLNVRVRIIDPDSIFSIFAKLYFENNRMELISSQVGDVLGSSIIYQPPVVTGGTIDFGMTRTSGQQGVNANGLVYSFKFKLTNLPNLAFNVQTPSVTDTRFRLRNPTVNDVTGAQRNMHIIPFDSLVTKIRYYVPVWPGDLNNDHYCNVADILPIGYFYAENIPARPNASIQWVAQPAVLDSSNNWGLLKTNKNDGAWRVFADANGNGTIDLADQNAIGFNLGNIHALPDDNNPLKNEARANEPPLAAVITETQIDSTQLPYTLNVKINLGEAVTSANNVLGVAFNVLFDPECVDTNDITTTYTNLFGNLGTTYIKIEDFRNKGQGILGIGATRFNTTGINADGDEVVTVTFKLKDGCADGWFNVIPQILACNDPDGNDIVLASAPDSVRVIKTTAINDPLDLKSMVSLYPNPNRGTVFIKSNLKETLALEVFNSMGQLLLSDKKKGGDTIDLSTAAGGVYYVRVSTAGKTGVYKVVKE